MRIMIVEDDVIPANYLKKILEVEGYEVIAMISRGAQAIEVKKKEKPDLIFMDVMLKDHISGAEAATEIYYAYPEIMIVFLTAFSDKEMIEYAVESDAFAYLLKPYRDQEILATLVLAKAKLSTNKKHFEKNIINNNKIKLVDGYVYDSQLNRLFLNNKEVMLSPKSLQLVQLLCNHKEITLEINTILEALWDLATPAQTLRSLIRRVRISTSENLIQNVNKFGYRIGLNDR